MNREIPSGEKRPSAILTGIMGRLKNDIKKTEEELVKQEAERMKQIRKDKKEQDVKENPLRMLEEIIDAIELQKKFKIALEIAENSENDLEKKKQIEEELEDLDSNISFLEDSHAETLDLPAENEEGDPIYIESSALETVKEVIRLINKNLDKIFIIGGVEPIASAEVIRNRRLIAEQDKKYDKQDEVIGGFAQRIYVDEDGNRIDKDGNLTRN